MNQFAESLCVDKDNCLGQGQSFEGIHNELNLLLWLTFKLILFYMVQL